MRSPTRVPMLKTEMMHTTNTAQVMAKKTSIWPRRRENRLAPPSTLFR
jgi:hypothetical protein